VMGNWSELNEYVLFQIFQLLGTKEVERAALVCKRWFWLTRDDILWKERVQTLFKTKALSNLSPGTPTWRDEFRRLSHHVPQCFHTEESVHDGGVTHVVFSSDGSMFATCGEDARLLVWKVDANGTENTLIVEEDLHSKFGWTTAKKVQFNKNGSLLMVTGVLKVTINKARMGEIIVFECKGEDVGDIRSRISLKPHDTVGCWYNNSYLISSDFEWLAHFISCNKFWINKVDYTMDADPSLACMRQLYRLYNCAGSCVRDVSVVPIHKMSSYNYACGLSSQDPDTVLAAYLALVEQHCIRLVMVPSHDDLPEIPESMDNRKIAFTWENEYIVDYDEDPCVDEEDYDQELCSIKFDGQYHDDRADDFINGRDDEDWLWEDEELCEDDYEFQWEYFKSDTIEEPKEDIVVDEAAGEEVLNEDEKLMIFSTGARTSLPHQIGIKLMSKIKFKKKLNIPKNIKLHVEERIQARREEREALQGRLDVEIIPWNNYKEVAQMFDVVDVIFDFSGYVTGYAVSPESRYLFVNFRPWAKNAFISDPYIPPPAALSVERVVIDLTKMEIVGRSHPRQRIFIPADLCEPTPIQVSRHFVTTTIKDRGVIIDRHSGVTVASLPHESVTGCAINPHDADVALTVGEDGCIKHWQSMKRSMAVNEKKFGSQ